MNRKWLGWVAVLVVGLIVSFCAGGGGGTDWFDGFDFEGWPIGQYGTVYDVQTVTDAYPTLVPVTVSITSECGEFWVEDSGIDGFGAKSLSPGTCGFRLLFGPSAKTVSATMYGTGKKSALWCWSDESQIGTRTDTFRVLRGSGKQYFSGGPQIGWVACEARGMYADEVIARSE